jgi:hypothetical protein
MTLLSQPRFIATGRKDAKEMPKRTADNADIADGRTAYPRHLRFISLPDAYDMIGR